ncbi:ATP-binding protein [Actinomadura rupiterrae]|uniref:ATP-binding protein n=1 Tax=Actinomadura rupiterrae TaxID=559627 RepID=UPI0020A40FF7|nr:ATP-binding protein [Actinomadura rupiterrae]MCP2337703.1 serine/threonine-protein kinase RsbW [Actinomadura rupiterrae]
MKFSLALPREALSIPVVRRVVGDALRGLGVAEDCVSDILVATSEACTNVVQHARNCSDYEVVGHVDDGVCLLQVTDWGHGHGPRHTPEPSGDGLPLDASGSFDPGALRESGRGLRIMRALLDDLTIETAPDRGTVVQMHKRLTWRDESLIRRLEHPLARSAG